MAEGLAWPKAAIDLIDTPRANLAMRAAIAEKGMGTKGSDGQP